MLVGVPGAGKTTVGGALAALLDVEFIDTDQLVERAAGKSVSDIFTNDGEPVFREFERAAVVQALAGDRCVVALGGGAVMSPETRKLLAQVPTVWLRVSTDAASKRVGLGVSRPMLMGSVRSQLVTMTRERTPLYEEVASFEVETDSGSPQQIASQILAKLVPGDE